MHSIRKGLKNNSQIIKVSKKRSIPKLLLTKLKNSNLPKYKVYNTRTNNINIPECK